MKIMFLYSFNLNNIEKMNCFGDDLSYVQIVINLDLLWNREL